MRDELLENYISTNTIPTIFLEKSRGKDAHQFSFLGGWPIADNDFKWPGDSGRRGKHAYSFIGQICLNDLTIRPEGFPEDGILYFFFDPYALEGNPEIWHQHDLDNAIQSGNEEEIERSKAKFEQQPRPVCVLHGPIPNTPQEIRPKKSRTIQNKKNLYHYDYNGMAAPGMDKNAYGKAPIEFVQGDSFIYPEDPLPIGLPDTILDELSDRTKTARRNAYAKHFSKDDAEKAFSDEQPDTLPITSILSNLPDWAIEHPVFENQRLDGHYSQLETIVADSWPQSWDMVTAFVDETDRLYAFYANGGPSVVGAQKLSKTGLRFEVENRFFQKIEELRILGKNQKETYLVSEESRKLVRQQISDLFEEIYIEWHRTFKKNHEKARRSKMGQTIERIKSAISKFLQTGKIDFSNNVFFEVDMIERDRLSQLTANMERQHAVLAIQTALKDVVRTSHKTVSNYIHCASTGQIANDAPRIEKPFRISGLPHQMFGYGFDVQGAVGRRHNAGYIMLLQLEEDGDMGFATAGGNLQIWISPEDAKAGRWERAEWNFDVT